MENCVYMYKCNIHWCSCFDQNLRDSDKFNIKMWLEKYERENYRLILISNTDKNYKQNISILNYA